MKPILLVTLCAFLAGLVASSPARAAAESPIELRVSYSSVTAQAKPMLVLEFYMKRGDKWKRRVAILNPTNGAPFDAASYQLKDAAGHALTASPKPEALEGQLGDSIAFQLQRKLDETQDHDFIVLPNKLHFSVDGQEFDHPGDKLTIPKSRVGEINAAMDADQLGKSENSIELAGGNIGGIGSIRYRYSRYEFLNASWLNLDFNAQADFTLASKDRHDFFNHVSGELNFFHPVNLAPDDWHAEFGVHAKTESDQTFSLTDGLLGVQAAVRLSDPVTSAIGGLFTKNDRATPLLVLGYDYAKNLDGDESTVATATQIDTGRADHRVRGVLRWRIPLARSYEFSFLGPLKGNYDLDLDLEAKGLYDINAEKFLDQSRVSLVFRQSSDRQFRPAFSFTWARGKEAPTFEQISAFLAGLKLEF